MNRFLCARRSRRNDDAGYSLIEVLVTIGVMSVLMVVFTTAILQVYRTSGKAESIAAAQSELQRAFQRFDRELRYASWVAEPARVGTAWYVEFAGFDATECLQLRLETAPASVPEHPSDGRGVLQLLRWAPGSPPARGTPGQTVASHVVAPADTEPPFQRQDAGATPYDDSAFTTDFERLRIRLTARTGTADAHVDTTFTALNTHRDTPPNHPCSEGRPSS